MPESPPQPDSDKIAKIPEIAVHLERLTRIR
jgi:hypothetical protein